MGNKSTRPPVPAPVSVEEVEELPAGGLSHSDALAIALAWRDQLRGCLRLETDSDQRGLHIAESFEWISFMFDGAPSALDSGFKHVENVEDTVTAARVATIAWYALSCCSGYSGDENPRFWRRVFTELYYPEYPKSGIAWRKPESDRLQRPITEATPFFPNKDKPFPRIRIMGQETACLQIMLSRPLSHSTDLHVGKLRRILSQLQPFILPSRWGRRPIPVAVEDISPVDVSSIFRSGVLERDPPVDVATIDALPFLQVSTIFFHNPFDLQFQAWVHEILDRTTATIVVPLYRVRCADQTLDWLMVHDDAIKGRVRFSVLELLPGTSNLYPSVLSALPQSASVTTVRFNVQPHDARRDGVRTDLSHAADWAWLGYAVFHPDIASHGSSFTDLDLELPGVSLEKIKAFARMATGNNLLNDDAGHSTLSSPFTTYEIARVRATTVAFADPRDDAELLWTFPVEVSITLCTAPGTSAFGNWVRAVVPGVGFGWIRSHSIIEVTSRSPGVSCLKGLRLKIHSESNSDNTMLTLLSVVGQRLEHLEIQDSKLMDTERVLSILRLCPSLTALRISHNGSCWSEKTAIQQTPSLPRLEKLELMLQHAEYNDRHELEALVSPHLNDLTTLRVVTAGHENFSTNRQAFLATLARYPRLRYAHHANGNGSDPVRVWEHISYEERRAEMLAVLGKIQRGVHDVFQGPLRPECRVAFLSVVRRLASSETSRWSVLQRFGPDIIGTIFAFATSLRPRELFVDPCSAGRSYSVR